MSGEVVKVISILASVESETLFFECRYVFRERRRSLKQLRRPFVCFLKERLFDSTPYIYLFTMYEQSWFPLITLRRIGLRCIT